jgi:uncharacterized protein with PIN domain
MFRFYGNLNDFLPLERRQIPFAHEVKDRASIKDAIEALGVPHPEVELILVHGESVSFAYLLQAGDFISVYPRFTTLDIAAVSKVRPLPLSLHRFVLDVHLGKLASYLRLLGFDVLYRNDYDDEELAQISHQQQRILLTQDAGLLKRSVVTYGYRVRSHHPPAQVREILARFQLSDQVAPWQRCPRCNGLLEPVQKQAISHRLPDFTRLSYDEFFQCRDCQHLYWKGAHYKRLQQLMAQFIASAD